YDNIAPTVEITSTTSMDTNIYEIPVKIMFSEDVTGFALEDIVMSNATPKADSFEVVSAREYNVIADAQTSGQLVTVDVAAGVAFDSAGNGNTEATQFTRRYDRIRPFSVVTSPDTVYITDESPIPIVITFYQSTTANETESVTGFDLADIIVINGTAGNLTGSGHIYYADITPDGEGIVDISIIDSAAQDAAGNPSRNHSSYPSLTRVYDVNPPSVNISSSVSTTNTSPIPVTFTFSEAVTGFTVDDISVSNGSLSNFIPVNGSTYTVIVTPLGQGQVTVDVAAGVATDAAGNFNTAAQFTSTYDTTAPSITISSSAGSATNISPIPVTFTFNESVTGFTLADISVTNGTASNLNTTDNMTFTATIAPSSQGNVRVNVAAGVVSDTAGNGNTAAAEFVCAYDTTRPSASILSSAAAYITSTFNVNIQFSEVVTGFALDDITVANGTASNITTADNRNYSVTITPTNQGTVTVNVSTNAAYDAAGNGNTLVNAMTRVYDTIGPNVTIDSTAGSYTNISLIPVSITFNENVTDMQISDITVTNGTAGMLRGSGSTYTISIAPIGEDQITISIGSGSVIDAAGNANYESNEYTLIYDITSPILSISSSSNNVTNTSPIPVTFTFNEAVTGFTLADITVTNGTASNLNNTDNMTFTATITPSSQGNVRVNVASSVASDAAGNGNTAAAEFVCAYDTTRPSASIFSSAAAYVNSSFTANIQFSEVVTGFALDDITVTNGTASNLTTADNRNYSVTITPTNQGTVAVNIATNTVFDAAGNGNSLVMGMTRVYDTVNPTVTIDSSLSSYTNTSPIPLTITFSETVTGFTADDIAVTNGTKGALSGSGSTYTIDIIPFAQGAVRVNILSAVATDLAGNSNTAALEFVIGYDTVAPVTTIDTMQLNKDTNDSTDFITKYADQTLYIVLTHRLSLTELVEISMDNGVTWTNFNHAANSYSSNNNITLLNGTHNIKLRIVDLAGNIGPVTTQQYTLDTDRPTVQVTSTVTEPT
ncbi:MAG TPA: Ig-like domain-containing protein, partial [Clostridia bacterium]|nr:Ig-like domain-containing protein [Clostridia bacterium]